VNFVSRLFTEAGSPGKDIDNQDSKKKMMLRLEMKLSFKL